MNIVTLNKAFEMILETNGKFFSAVFTKKNGSDRYITGRLGVKKHLTGKGMSYRPSDYGLIPIFDIHKNQYRMINLKTLKSVSEREAVKYDAYTEIQGVYYVCD